MNKIYRFKENTSKMTFPEKIKKFCVKIICFYNELGNQILR